MSYGVFAYRLPRTGSCNDTMLQPVAFYGDIIESLDSPNYPQSSFVISDFYGKRLEIEAKVKIPIDYLSEFADVIIDEINTDYTPVHSTSQTEHSQAVEIVIEEISKGNIHKAVVSKRIVKPGAVDIGLTFTALCDAYPHAMVFLFATPQTGVWMGASPEILLTGDGVQAQTMALAGTRLAKTPGPWDAKNINEQANVVRFIRDILDPLGVTYEIGKTDTYPAGPVEHLHTDIKVYGISENFAEELSPTSALAGMPRDAALDIIARVESTSRRQYGGYFGPLERDESGYPVNYSYYVTLRCMEIGRDSYTLYVGGGIMADSDPDDEWLETERKALTLSRHIRLKES